MENQTLESQPAATPENPTPAALAPESIPTSSAESSTPPETPSDSAPAESGGETTPDAPKMPQPRTMPEIEAEYGQLVAMAGEAYFQREFHDFNLKQMLGQHRRLMAEGQARKNIDDKLAESAQAKAEDKRAKKAAKRAAALKAGLSPADADALANEDSESPAPNGATPDAPAADAVATAPSPAAVETQG